MPAPSDASSGRVAASPADAAVPFAAAGAARPDAEPAPPPAGAAGQPAAAAPDLPPLPSLRPGRYRHHKGGRYRVLGVVRHSETLEPMALYRPLDAAVGDWVRPLAMFVETVEVDGRVLPRFRCEEPPEGRDGRDGPRADASDDGSAAGDPVDAGDSCDPIRAGGLRAAPTSGPGPASLADLQATVARMEARLGADPRPAVALAWAHYGGLRERFAQDLAGAPREVLLARASALMLLQAIARGDRAAAPDDPHDTPVA